MTGLTWFLVNISKSIERIELEDVMSSVDIPDDWIKQMFNRYFTEDEINRIKSQGGIEKLLKTLKQRLKEQKKDIKEEINGLELQELLHSEHMGIILRA